MRSLGWIIASVLAWPTVAGAESATSFRGLGALAGSVPQSAAAGISGDGVTVVGGCPTTAGSCQAWRWTEAQGLQPLGVLPGDVRSGANDVSPDGAWIVGASDGKPFRWSSITGLEALAPVTPGEIVELAVDGDGDTIVGTFFDSSALSGGIFRWTPPTGVVVIRSFDVPDLTVFSDLSDDGVTVAGSEGVPDDTTGFRWTLAGGFVPIPGLEPMFCECGTSPRAMSPDASVLVGDSRGQAFRWTAAGGSLGLGFLGPATFGSFSSAAATSADGSVIVGSDASDGSQTAFVWTAQTGLVTLRSVLVGLGLGAELAGWQLQSAVGISHDGKVIAGNGIDPLGLPEAWIAVVPSVTPHALPALGAAGLTALGALLMAPAVWRLRGGSVRRQAPPGATCGLRRSGWASARAARYRGGRSRCLPRGVSAEWNDRRNGRFRSPSGSG